MFACVCLLLSLAVPAAGYQWQEAMQVQYNRAGAPMQERSVKEALDYAAAAWEARTGARSSFAGVTTHSGYQRGKTIIRWVDALEMMEIGTSPLRPMATRKWIFSGSERVAGAEIYLNADMWKESNDCFLHALLHEFGHALGISGHSPDATDVMYSSLLECHHTLTAEDAERLAPSHRVCHAELKENMDLYVPVVKTGGGTYAAWLRYVEGGWELDRDSLHKVKARACGEVSFSSGMDLLMERIWSPDGEWGAGLAWTGEWRWELDYAWPLEAP